MRISDWSSDVCSSDLLGLTRSPAQSLAEGQVASPSPWAATLRRSLRILGLVGFAVALSSVWGIDLFHAASTQLGARVVRGGSAARSVGKEGVRTCRSRGSPYH